MSYGTSTTLDVPFAEAVTRVRAALKEQGFGVLTEMTSPPPCRRSWASRSRTT